MPYTFIGCRARVQLYDRFGIVVKAIEGRIADVAPQFELPGATKDLVFLVDVVDADETPYQNSAGGSGEGWFALADCQILGEDGVGLALN